VIGHIKAELDERNWTWADLSRLTGIPEQRFNDWRGGSSGQPRGEPRASQLARIARALDVPMERLVEGQAVPGSPWRRELFAGLGQAVAQIFSAARRLEDAAQRIEELQPAEERPREEARSGFDDRAEAEPEITRPAVASEQVPARAAGGIRKRRRPSAGA
jgi:transcriptional regulator with XRE-family HTH domain